MTPIEKKFEDHVDGSWFFDPKEHCGVPELAYTALGLYGEAGEYCEKVKKTYRDSGGVPDREGIRKELGDCLFYLTKLAHILDLRIFNIDPKVKDADKFVDKVWVFDLADCGGVPELAFASLVFASAVGRVVTEVTRVYDLDYGKLTTKSTEKIREGVRLVLYMIIRAAHLNGDTLDDVVAANIEKLESRRLRDAMSGSGDNR